MAYPADEIIPPIDMRRHPMIGVEGKILSLSGMGIEIADHMGLLELGDRVLIPQRQDSQDAPASLTQSSLSGSDTGLDHKPSTLLAEIVMVGERSARALPFGVPHGIRRGQMAQFDAGQHVIKPHPEWRGRVIDGLARPVDGKGPLPKGEKTLNLRASPPPAAQRARLGPQVDFGVKALNAFTPARQGQRLGIFSGSGVGKSVLLGMLAQHTDCDVRIIALIGERGREVREFIENDLGPEGLANSIIIVATADEPALMRREAGFLAMSLAEHYRDTGAHVVCMMDSLTRIAMAQREIGLAAGEPPASRGYTPSVFSMLPALLERAGPGLEAGVDGQEPGAITGLFTVLVEGDDPDEPIADHCRAILDGHIFLDRAIAERGRFPAVNILKSLSRTAASLMDRDVGDGYIRARQLAALYEDMQEMIKIGAYQPGANHDVDCAIDFWAGLEEFLTQSRHKGVSVEETQQQLLSLINAVTPHRA